jgi:hypothetical protein
MDNFVITMKCDLCGHKANISFTKQFIKKLKVNDKTNISCYYRYRDIHDKSKCYGFYVIPNNFKIN